MIDRIALALLVLAMAGLLGLVIAVSARGQEPEAESEARDRHVVRSWVVKPKKEERVKRKFTPTATPSPSKVKRIIDHEHARWGGPPIHGRVWCESRYAWNATNGQYQGLLQIGPIWGYLWSGTPRKVRIKKVKTKRRPVWRYRKWSDGTRGRVKVRRMKVKRVIVRKGKLPANPSPYHGWAAVRVGQRAVAGYRTTSWSCGL